MLIKLLYISSIKKTYFSMSHPRVHQIEIRANMVIADVKEHCKLFEIQIEHSNVYMLQSLL